jgi:hypothetical protein
VEPVLAKPPEAYRGGIDVKKWLTIISPSAIKVGLDERE